VALARRVAHGVLTASEKVTLNDETGELMTSLQHMAGKLNRIVGSVRATSNTIATASAEVASGDLNLSSRYEQASSIEETMN
jgi:methyl-accepting chemotaxis protein